MRSGPRSQDKSAKRTDHYHVPHSAHRLTTGLAWGLLAVAVTGATVALALAAAKSTDWEHVIVNVAMSIALSVCGALLTAQRPRNPIGWLLLAGGIVHTTSA